MPITRTRISKEPIEFLFNIPRTTPFKKFMRMYANRVGFVVVTSIARDIIEQNPGVKVIISGRGFKYFSFGQLFEKDEKWLNYKDPPLAPLRPYIRIHGRMPTAALGSAASFSRNLKAARVTRAMGSAESFGRHLQAARITRSLSAGSFSHWVSAHSVQKTLGVARYTKHLQAAMLTTRVFGTRTYATMLRAARLTKTLGGIRLSIILKSQQYARLMRPLKWGFLRHAGHIIETRMKQLTAGDPSRVSGDIEPATAEDIHQSSGREQLFPQPPGGSKGTDPTKKTRPRVKTRREIHDERESTVLTVYASMIPDDLGLWRGYDVTVQVPDGGFARADGKPFVMHKPEGTIFRTRTYKKYGGQWITRRGRGAEYLLRTLRQSKGVGNIYLESSYKR